MPSYQNWSVIEVTAENFNQMTAGFQDPAWFVVGPKGLYWWDKIPGRRGRFIRHQAEFDPAYGMTHRAALELCVDPGHYGELDMVPLCQIKLEV